MKLFRTLALALTLAACDRPSEPGTSPANTQGNANAQKFLKKFKNCVLGTPYRPGGEQCGGYGSDCSGAIKAAMSGAGFPMVGRQADKDMQNFRTVPCNQLRPGDTVLIGYSCAAPDHWIVMVDLKNPGYALDPGNTIVDQSTDCAPRCKQGGVRSNLRARAVCACARHLNFF